jgi:sarcosine oxidase
VAGRRLPSLRSAERAGRMNRNLPLMIYDAIIAGLGAMGSAAAFHLSRRGARVLGLDRYRPPHLLGSSHGKSRIIRQAYFEHPQYVPLVQRAYSCWAELERLTGVSLLVRTGGLMVGHPDSAVVRGALRSALEHGLAYDTLDRRALHARYPVFHAPEDAVAVWEPDAGFLRPEACIDAHLTLARSYGATLAFDEGMSSWTPTGDGVSVVTSSGTYSARRLILAAGAWMAELLPELHLPLTVERCVQHWFEPGAHATKFDSRHFPVFIWEYAPERTWYGIPSDTAVPTRESAGVKLALHHQGVRTRADSVVREVTSEDTDPVRSLVQRLLPDADGAIRESIVCLYTNTPDEDFIIDSPAEFPQVVVVSACSGHGFKFSSAIGEAVAQMVLDEHTALDLTPFRLARFTDVGSPSRHP